MRIKRTPEQRHQLMLRIGVARGRGDSFREIASRESISTGYVESLAKEYRSFVASEPDNAVFDAPLGRHERASGLHRSFEARGARGRTLAQANRDFLQLLHLEMLSSVRASRAGSAYLSDMLPGSGDGV